VIAEFRREIDRLLAEAQLALAQRLGGKVVLMGHSTGALLLTWLASRNPVKVADLILFSPAFGVHSFAQTGAWASYLTRIDLVTAERKVSTSHSGLEVDRAARAFRAWLRANSRDGRPYTYASERLKDVPVDDQHTGRHRDSKARGAGFYEGDKGKEHFRRFTQGIVAVLVQSCASRRDHHAVQSRLAAYQKLFERIFRRYPLSLVD
jgi:pimeloyl-ACP methyl ester carboxylesterase